MNINEICEKASEIEKHFGWPTQPIPKTLELALTHITQLEENEKKLRLQLGVSAKRMDKLEEENKRLRKAVDVANFAMMAGMATGYEEEDAETL